jgi:hypothetical protein
MIMYLLIYRQDMEGWEASNYGLVAAIHALGDSRGV